MAYLRAIRHRRCWLTAALGLLLLSIGLGNSVTQADTNADLLSHKLFPVSYVPDASGQSIFGQPLVQVTLNGTTTATFLVDTGCDSSVISNALARKLGLPLAPAVNSAGKPYFFKGGAEQATMGKVTRISIGGLRFDDQQLVVAEEKAFKLNLGFPYDGVIGMSLLRYTSLLFDTQQHTLTFCYPGSLEPRALTELGFITPYILQITDDEGVGWVQAQFANHGVTGEERLMVDTGSNKTCVPKRLAEHIGLRSASQQQEITLFGNDTTDIESVETLHLGRLVLFDFPLTVFSRTKNTKTLAAPSLLGLDILSGYRVLMDFPGGKLYLQPYPSAVPAVTIGPAHAPATPPVK